jgi:hypothetical protein
VHRATLADVLAHFGTSTVQRAVVARRLARIYGLAQGTGLLARFVVCGSFVTAKPAPNDVDIFMVIDDAFGVSQVTGAAAVIFDHLAAHNYEGARVFWVRRMAALGGEAADVEHWQTQRDGTSRGIVEVSSDD